MDVRVLAVAGCFFSALLAFAPLSASANPELGKKHVQLAGGKCTACHDENPPSKAPPQAKCEKCHGDLKAVGSKPLPKQGMVNPHLTHVDELYCSDCHKMHTASKNYCQQCHDDGFKFKIP